MCLYTLKSNADEHEVTKFLIEMNQRKNYKEEFDRNTFILNVELQTIRGKLMQNADDNGMHEFTKSIDNVPNIEFLHSYNILTGSDPA